MKFQAEQKGSPSMKLQKEGKGLSNMEVQKEGKGSSNMEVQKEGKGLSNMEVQKKGKESRPLVSIITPIYNTAPYLRRCLDSILAQTYRNLEIILVDDGSTDGSYAIMEAYERRDGRIRTLRQANGGQAAARNAGLDMATGDWIVFVDSDDEAAPCLVEALLGAALREGAEVAAGSHVRYEAATGTQRCKSIKTGLLTGREAFQYFFCEKQITVVWACIFQKKLFAKHRFPEGRIYEDTYLLAQILCDIRACACVETTVYFYYQRSDGTMLGSDLEKRLDWIWVMRNIEELIADAVPECVGEIQSFLLYICCQLMDHAATLGIGEHAAAWKQIVAAFSDTRDRMKRKNLREKTASLLFDISPFLLVKTWRLYRSLMDPLRNRMHGKPA